MADRRAVIDLHIDYATKTEATAAVPGLLKELIESQDDVRFGRAALTGLGQFAIEVQAIYYVTHPDYQRFVEIREQLSLAILQAFEAREVRFAYPTQTILLRSPAPS